MDKESLTELQRIDANCNDCIFMQRDSERFNQSLQFHHKMQLDAFNLKRDKLIRQAEDKRYSDGDYGKWNDLLMVADKMKFIFDKSSVTINYGNCTKLNKAVSFIPNQCQLHTQNCFKHRKDNE